MIAKIWTSSIAKASMILEKADRVLVFLVVFLPLLQLLFLWNTLGVIYKVLATAIISVCNHKLTGSGIASVIRDLSRVKLENGIRLSPELVLRMVDIV
jgi:hypothetical protein